MGKTTRPNLRRKSNQSVWAMLHHLWNNIDNREGIRILSWIKENNGLPHKIKQILNKAGKVCEAHVFNESRREAYVDFACYCGHVKELSQVLTRLLMTNADGTVMLDANGDGIPFRV